MMPQYLLAVWHDEPVEFDPSEPPTPDMQRQFDQVGELNQALDDAAALVFANGLTSPAHANVVRAADGSSTTTAGPYSPVDAHMGGFWVIEAADLDAALAWAERASTACERPVEVRPFHGA